jgi:parvulin-like peptidyl-prolyl isomerase
MKEQKDIRIIVISVLCTLLIVAVGGAVAYKKYIKNSLKDSDIFATSKMGNVSVGEVKEYLLKLEKTFNRKFDITTLNQGEKDLVVGEIVNGRVIVKKAKENGLQKTNEYKEKIKESENNVLKEMFIQNLVKENITDDSVNKKYDELVTALTGKKEFKVKHILVKTKDEISKVINELKTNTFADVARKYSIDNSKENGGELGYVVEGQIVKEFGDVLKAQPINRLSKPFETQFGWHVLIKEDERDAIIPEFEQIKDIIRSTVIRELIRDYSLKNIENMDIKILK